MRQAAREVGALTLLKQSLLDEMGPFYRFLFQSRGQHQTKLIIQLPVKLTTGRLVYNLINKKRAFLLKD